ncbi:hypothetical protein [Marinimicrobium sp. ABcell2]|uniref:hypothetical protein n=1 Tax=Marinimicrobium sp. ABcell2 TaxID=3069751 RepID=UPI0027B75329|nr:hypothetical protein [Marinimicrobium sp. ABcell2]MDQ2076885.1 S41 family peptidase [Marinimicrobium sp. ABcell2]
MKTILVSAALCLVVTTAPVLASSKSTAFTNDATARPPSVNFPANGAEYWVMRSQAVALAKNGEWEKAIPLLEKLVKQYQDDGDTWFLLGHGYLQIAQYSKAIPALKQTLQLGTILTGVESTSYPSNDIMINIAHSYSASGNKPQALAWIQKALDFRWDDRMSLIESDKFERISDDSEYKKLSGAFLEQNLSRNEYWTKDLQFLLSEIKRLHVDPYHTVSKEDLYIKAESIAERIPELSDQQIVFNFMELLASVGNGHNFVVPTHSLKGAFTRLPVEFYWFSDGIYVVNAEPTHRHLIGRKVITVEGTPVSDVLTRIASINARDNEMQQYWLGPYYLSMPEVLNGLGIVSDTKEIAFTFVDENGNSELTKLSGGSFNFSGFPTLPAIESTNNPEYLRRKDENYWYFENTKDNYIYVQLNAVAQNESQSISDFSDEIHQRIADNKVENLVLDLRHNSGGDGSILPPLTRVLIHFEAQSKKNRLFVIVGRNTFSAAHLLLADINRLTDAVIVGEPSGSRPNHLGEAGWFKLPYSGVWGIVSSQHHQASMAEDHRLWVAPHLPVTLSSENYFSGEDPAMNQIIEVINRSN